MLPSPPSEQPARSLAVAVVWDDERRKAANRQRRNYWYSYIWDVLERLGVTASPISPSQLARPHRLKRFAAVIAGDLPAQSARAAAGALTDWVRRGGMLIGFAAEGLDDLFGIRPARPITQPKDDFAITGYIEFVRSTLTEGIHSPLQPGQRLIIISPVRPVRPEKCAEIARFFRPHPSARDDGSRARDTGLAVAAARRLGRGWAFYIGFDLPRTIWAIQQGRPIDADHDGDGYLRFGDAMVIGNNSPQVAYSEEIVLLLQTMLARRPLPMLHQLPARQASVPDALFYFGGDDECQRGVQLSASNFMKSRRLPYHINLMPLRGRFAITRKEYNQIRANGHELSLHYNFMDGFKHPGPFAQRDVAKQAALFRKTFGRNPICTVNHWCRWTGWAEPAKWMLAAGGKADNSRINVPLFRLNPVNTLGFAFGTPFPFFFRDDWRGQNARIPFLQEPIIAYEIGYTNTGPDFPMLNRAVDMAARCNMTMNMFYHPVYIHTYPQCRRAIDELLRYLRARRIKALFMGNDELWRWWWQRSRARIRAAHLQDGTVSFKVRCEYKSGFVVKVPVGAHRPRRCLVDGRPSRCHVQRRFGQNWALLPLRGGEQKVELQLDGRPASR
jgi:hypothetical protein